MQDEQAMRHEYKNKIITELYNSGRLQKQVKLLCFKNKIPISTFIHEDILHHTMLFLCAKGAEEIIEAYENQNDRPGKLDRLVALCVTIAIRKGVYKGTNDNPKTSLLNELLYTSNLKYGNKTLSETYEREEDAFIVDPSSEAVLNDEQLAQLLRENLTDDEMSLLTFLTDGKKGPGRYKKDVLEKREALASRIKQIIQKYKDDLNG